MLEHGRQDAAARLTRAALIRRGIAGGAAVAFLGTLPARGLGWAEATAARRKGEVHGFVTRPDLRPPVISVLRHTEGAGEGYLFLAPASGPGMRGGLIADDRGDPVYFHPTAPRTVMDFRPGLLRGAPVLSWWEGRYVRGVGKVGEYVVVDSSYREIARFATARHRRPDFHEVLLTDDGALLVTAYETVAADLRPVGGPSNGLLYGGVVQELAIPSGRLLWEWRSLDHVDVTETVSDQLGSPFDYFHINGIDVDGDGNLLVSARNTSALYKVDRRNGKVLWRLGGKRSDFSMGKGTAFGFQHDPRFHEGGRTISLFDNGPRPGERRPESRAIVLAVDQRRKQVTLKREIRHRPPLFAFATGANQLLPNGNRLVTWGITGWFTEYGPDGTVLLDASLPERGQNYRVFRSPWAGKPTVPPAFKAYRQDAGQAQFYASWNGATALAGWRLETGRTPGMLSAGGVHPRRGFETSFAIPPRTRYAAVVALDAAGAPLGRSRTIRLY
ncbi:MAG: arylsulfotransferase family protein [Verrucomicrobiota bacterium]